MASGRVVHPARTVAFGASVSVPDECTLVEVLIPTINSGDLSVAHSVNGTDWVAVLKDTEGVKTFPATATTGNYSLVFRVIPGGFIKFTSSVAQTAAATLVFHS